MEIFNIGIGELLVILVLMYVLLGPQGMLRAARWLGQMTQQAYRFFNETWRSITDVPMDLRDLPNALLKETGLKETVDELRQEGRAAQMDLNRDFEQAGIGKKLGTEKPKTLPEPKISPPGTNGPAVPEHIKPDLALAGPAVLAGAAALSGEDEAAPGLRELDHGGSYDLQIRPVQQAVAADVRPAAEAAEAAIIAAEQPRPKRGRPRKGEVRPPPEPKIPRKRGRPPKNRPEATAGVPAASAEPANNLTNAPVKERPGVRTRPAGEGRMPRKAPSQPGDPIVPIDLEASGGARAYASNPAPSEDEEKPDRNAA